MSTKGPSNRYGSHSTSPTKHTGYAWAKDFNKNTLKTHFNEHGNGFSTIKEYVAHAISFANFVDRTNNISFIDKQGSTHRFNKKTGEFSVITKDGIVITYFIPREGMKYYKNDRIKNKR